MTQGGFDSEDGAARNVSRISAALVLSLGLMAVICVVAPRAMAFLPPLAGLGGFLAWHFSPARKRGSLSWGAMVLCAAPLVVGMLSLLWADGPGEAFGRIWKMALTLLPGGLLLCLLPVLPSDPMRRWSRVLPILVGVSALALGSDLAFGLPVLRALAGVPDGVEFDPFHANRGIVVLTLLFFPAIGMIQEAEAWSVRVRAGAAVGLFLCLAFLLLEGESQSAQMAFVFGLAAMVFFPVRAKAAWKGIAAVFSGLILAAPWLAIFSFARFPHWFSSIREANIAPRLEIWDFVARRALEHPFLGHGIEATRREVFDTAQLYFQGNTVLHPHNFALQLWMEFGAFGAAVGALFLGVLLWRISLFPARSARVALAAFVAALSVGATGYGLWQAWWLGTLVLVSAWSLIVRKMDRPL